MPTLRQRLGSKVTRRYPLLSGCATFANKLLLRKLLGESSEQVWCDVPGGRVLASLDDYVGRAAYYVGDLDRKITWICSQLLRPGDTALDIGANIGIVTLWMSRLVGGRGAIHAFEPNPRLQRILNDTLVKNGVRNVSVHGYALGASSETLPLRIPRSNMGAASLVRNENNESAEVVEVPVLPLSEVVRDLKIKSIGLMKMDVEGFEAAVLRGGRQVLHEMQPPAILFELNEPTSGSIGDLPVIKILRDHGYGFFAIPKCLVRMSLIRFQPELALELPSHDYLAVPTGALYEHAARRLRASS